MSKSDTLKKILFVSIILAFMSVQSGMAGTTGKIAGIAVDASTEEALQGANIIVLYKVIDGEEVELPVIMGGATDQQGRYTILNVPPGVYVIHGNYMGYKKVVVRDVLVSVDHTTIIDFSMESTAVEGETVYVIGERDIIRKDVSATQSVTTGDQIQTMPVENLAQIINRTTPGVIQGSFRGGTGRVQYFADGISLNFDETWSNSFFNLNLLGISEMQVLLGGFQAEYGNVQDGVVNIIRKRPTKKFSIAVDAKYAPAQYRHPFGDIFDEDMLFYRTYDNLEAFGGDQAKLDLFRQQAAPFNYIWPEDHIQAFVSSPVPGLDFLGFTLGVSHHYTPGTYPSSRQKEYYGSEDLTFEPTLYVRLGQNANLTLGSVLNRNKSQVIAWAIPPWELYYTGWYPLRDVDRNQYFLKLDHVIGAKTFYEIRASYMDYRLKDRLSEDFVYPFTTTPAPAFQILGGDWYNLDDFKTKTLDISGDVTSQITSIHQFKAGAGIKFYDLDNFHLFTSTGNSTVYGTRDVNPMEGHAYVQDKIETRGMIVNVGLRLDWLSPDSPVYTNTWMPVPLDGTTPETRDGKTQMILQPRLGMSYPISENSIIYLNYGHFAERRQLESYSGYNYAYGTLSLEEGPKYSDWRRVNWLGNAELKYQKTTAYEVGVRTRFAKTLYTDMSAYYKNIYDQFRNFRYTDPASGYTYTTPGNGNYADVRGVQLKIVKERSGLWGFRLGYTYQIATEGMNTPETITPQNQLYPRASDAPRSGDVTHSAFVNFLFFIPPKTGPSLFGFYPLGGINIDFLFNARSGTPFTYQPANLTIVNNYRNPAYANADLLIEKDLVSNFVVYFQINNVFNRKQRQIIGFRGLADQQPWIDTSAGEFRFGPYYEYPAYYQFDNPRIFHVGIRFRG